MDKEEGGDSPVKNLLLSMVPQWAMVGAPGRNATKKMMKKKEEEEKDQKIKDEEDSTQINAPFKPMTLLFKRKNEEVNAPFKAMTLLLKRILDLPSEIRYTPFKPVPEIEEPEEVVVVPKSQLLKLEKLAREVGRSFRDGAY